MASISKRTSGAWQNTSYGIRATATDTITTLPTTIYGDGTNATVSIKGNTVQNGTPAPDSPIMPNGTGERTGNLWDEEYPNISGTIRYIPLYVGEGSFTLSTTTPYVSSVANIFLLSGNVSSGASTSENGAWLKHNVTAQSDDGYVTIAYRRYAGTTSPVDCQTMLNTGSTALPYEPYGYKIPISSAGQTTPVYLGEVSTTRKIKKRVLDGTETITEESANVYSIPIADTVAAVAGLSTHFEYNSTVSAGQFRIEAGKAVFGYNDTLANFSTFLAAQYAAGTPVTIWYVLAEPTTGIVNEPLMRIGDYEDEVSGVSIPTTDGANTLSIDTTVQPSEVSVNYHGWHMGTVHERTAGQWD